jgi:hypothetical protein
MVAFAPPPEQCVRLSLRIGKISGSRTEFAGYPGTCHLTIKNSRAPRWFSKRDRYGDAWTASSLIAALVGPSGARRLDPPDGSCNAERPLEPHESRRFVSDDPGMAIRRHSAE